MNLHDVLKVVDDAGRDLRRLLAQRLPDKLHVVGYVHSQGLEESHTVVVTIPYNTISLLADLLLGKIDDVEGIAQLVIYLLHSLEIFGSAFSVKCLRK